MAPILSRLSSGGGFGFGKKSGGAVPFTATGGTISTPGNGYTYHVFTSPDSLTVSSGTGNIEYLIVAGGGGGGGSYGGSAGGAGSGGGGVRSGSTIITPGAYIAEVGEGGTGGQYSPLVASTNGTNSSFNSIIAHGGGRGGGDHAPHHNGNPGGSGGGAAYNKPFPGPVISYGYNPGTPAPVLASAVPSLPSPYGITQGYNGGNADTSGPRACGGGGGAGGVGTDGGPSSGPGGAGAPFPAYAGPLFSPVMPSPWVSTVGPTGLYAGGGGGGQYSGSATTGGPGGGGAGGPTSAPGAGSNGATNTGGGAGGGGSPGPGGTGGSGIIIVRYAVS